MQGPAIQLAEPAPDFDPNFRSKLEDLFWWRRDFRRLQTAPLPSDAAEKLIEAVCLAPSVGLSESWRFVVVASKTPRRAMRGNYERANAIALRGYEGDDARLYASLKLSGMDDAPLQLAVFTDQETDQGRRLGRETMPETLTYSTVAAVHSLWLAALAEGIGVGWVSILETDSLNETLDVPAVWHFVVYLCVGYPRDVEDRPSLKTAGCESRRAVEDFLIERLALQGPRLPRPVRPRRVHRPSDHRFDVLQSSRLR